MIVSASRRTDIPALYAPWLIRRLEAGYCAVPHPFDRARVRRVDLRPAPLGGMDALVLWTRNPGPLLDAVPGWEAAGIRSLWMVTLTGYPREIEPHVPALEVVAGAVARLAEVIGRERITWRYDPLVLCPALGVDRSWHRRNFRQIAEGLAGTVGRCVISVYDDYAKSRRRLGAAGLAPDLGPDCIRLAAEIAASCEELDLSVQSCCEALEAEGVRPGACIDGALLDRLWVLGVGPAVDPGQRPGCRCAPSVDIGVYGTCTHGCLYCYATGSPELSRARRAAHDPGADSLSGTGTEESGGLRTNPGQNEGRR